MANIIHPRMFAALHRFYASACTIQQATVTQDTYGEEILTWADLAAHVDLDCAIAPSGGSEVKAPDGTYVISTHIIDLAGYYPLISEKMRAEVAGAYYDIILVEIDSQLKSTKLTCQIVE